VTAWIVSCAAVAVLAAHVLASAFIFPRAGTAAEDHLLSALVPIAVLACAVLLFPRLAPVWQAAVSLALGVITLAGGVVAA
jgi:hypothetical protein